MTYEYRIRNIRRVVDGDTYDLELDLGFYQYGVMRFRLLGVDTPEPNSRDPEQRDRAKAATSFVNAWFGTYHGDPDHVLLARTHKADSFGRWLADVYAVNANGHSIGLAESLLESGHGKVYE